MKSVLAILLGTTTLACATYHRTVDVPEGAGGLVGVYKAAVDDGRGRVRHMTASVWAQPPDRLHAEIAGPAGGVAYVLDAGGGRACLVDVSAGTAYVGEDDSGAVGSFLGVRMSIAAAVAALLSGTPSDAVAVERDGPRDPSLPDRLHLSDGARSVTLRRRSFARAADESALGTGAPPPRLAVRPLAELDSATADLPSGKPPS